MEGQTLVLDMSIYQSCNILLSICADVCKWNLSDVVQEFSREFSQSIEKNENVSHLWLWAAVLERGWFWITGDVCYDLLQHQRMDDITKPRDNQNDEHADRGGLDRAASSPHEWDSKRHEIREPVPLRTCTGVPRPCFQRSLMVLVLFVFLVLRQPLYIFCRERIPRSSIIVLTHFQIF